MHLDHWSSRRRVYWRIIDRSRGGVAGRRAHSMRLRRPVRITKVYFEYLGTENPLAGRTYLKPFRRYFLLFDRRIEEPIWVCP